MSALASQCLSVLIENMSMEDVFACEHLLHKRKLEFLRTVALDRGEKKSSKEHVIAFFHRHLDAKTFPGARRFLERLEDVYVNILPYDCPEDIEALFNSQKIDEFYLNQHWDKLEQTICRVLYFELKDGSIRHIQRSKWHQENYDSSSINAENSIDDDYVAFIKWGCTTRLFTSSNNLCTNASPFALVGRFLRSDFEQYKFYF